VPPAKRPCFYAIASLHRAPPVSGEPREKRVAYIAAAVTLPQTFIEGIDQRLDRRRAGAVTAGQHCRHDPDLAQPGDELLLLSPVRTNFVAMSRLGASTRFWHANRTRNSMLFADRTAI
jgi:hypothetical protein